jgi:hypothetical protein
VKSTANRLGFQLAWSAMGSGDVLSEPIDVIAKLSFRLVGWPMSGIRRRAWTPPRNREPPSGIHISAR